jgi:stress-induced morphogen
VQKDHIVARIQAALSDARVELEDLTGTADHWKARIVSSAFAGKTLIERHRMVMTALAEEMKGPIHALTFDALTPDEASQR